MAKRADVLRWLFNAGATGDQKEWTRLYIEHRISRKVADERWQAGQRFAAFCAKRDAEAEKKMLDAIAPIG